ncbi:MAG: SDR family oxidoreductase [Candidatus Nanopelagicales bacterium]
MFDLTGRGALITGAGQGLGAQIARVLAAQGASVLVNDLNPDRASAIVAEIQAAGGSATSAVADITDLPALRVVVEHAAQELGTQIDILVNNAGIPAEGMGLEPFVESDPGLWHRHVELNGYGLFNATYAVLPGMIERGWGRVVTITSDGGRVGTKGVAVYAAAKAMGPGFMRSLALEVGTSGVTCNCVSISSMRTAQMPADDERTLRMARGYATKRLGEPKDIAPAVLWLVSEEASWVTAQTVVVNGGFAAS